MTLKDGNVQNILHTGDFRADPDFYFKPPPPSLPSQTLLSQRTSLELPPEPSPYAILKLIPQLDALYLDTTYVSHPSKGSYDFPSQADVLRQVREELENIVKSSVPPKVLSERFSSTLFVCGSYTIGKEQIFMGLPQYLSSVAAEHLGTSPSAFSSRKIYIDASNKNRIATLRVLLGPSKFDKIFETRREERSKCKPFSPYSHSL